MLKYACPDIIKLQGEMLISITQVLVLAKTISLLFLLGDSVPQSRST